MSEESGNVAEVQEQSGEPEELQSSADAGPAEQGANDGQISVGSDEARNNNYVPYDRFKEVIEQRNQAQTALDDRQRMLDYYASVSTQQQNYAPEPPSAPTYDEYEDPLEVARQAKAEAQKLRAEIQASRQAEQIRSEIGKAVAGMGFVHPAKAEAQIQQEMGRVLQKTGRLPDVREVAMAIRQDEVDYEKQIISRYKSQKTGDAARAASTPPPSAPVLESQPEQKPGWDTASKRIRDRLARR